jgi:hypothetical protein
MVRMTSSSLSIGHEMMFERLGNSELLCLFFEQFGK